MKAIRYTVLVGNIGAVYDGDSRAAAMTAYEEYVRQSQNGYGRAAGEPVTVFEGTEILFEYDPVDETLGDA